MLCPENVFLEIVFPGSANPGSADPGSATDGLGKNCRAFAPKIFSRKNVFSGSADPGYGRNGGAAVRVVPLKIENLSGDAVTSVSFPTTPLCETESYAFGTVSARFGRGHDDSICFENQIQRKF